MLVLAALLACGPASAAGLEGASLSAAAAFLGAAVPMPSAALKKEAAPPPGASSVLPAGSLGAPSAVVPLPSLLDNVRRTKAAFRAGGAVVHVFGQKSEDQGGWFLGFAVEGGDCRFECGRNMLHWMFVNRTAHFSAGGRGYSAYVEGRALSPLDSRVVVRDDASGSSASWSIRELAEDVYEAGWPVTLGGREYRLIYTRDFREDGAHGFGGYTSDRSIVLLFRSGTGFAGYHWFEREIPRGSILVATPRGADVGGAAVSGARPIGLSLAADGSLDLFAAPQAVAGR